MKQFFDWIATWLLTFYDKVVEIVEWAMFTVAEFVLDFVYWIMDAVVALIVAAINASGITTFIESAYNAMPNSAVAIMSYLQIPFLLGLILAAYATRFAIRMVWK